MYYDSKTISVLGNKFILTENECLVTACKLQVSNESDGNLLFLQMVVNKRLLNYYTL